MGPANTMQPPIGALGFVVRDGYGPHRLRLSAKPFGEIAKRRDTNWHVFSLRVEYPEKEFSNEFLENERREQVIHSVALRNAADSVIHPGESQQ